MSQETEQTVTNQTLLMWCGVVIVELFVIAHLMQSALVLLIGLVLISPIRAAMNWPMAQQPESLDSNPKS